MRPRWPWPFSSRCPPPPTSPITLSLPTVCRASALIGRTLVGRDFGAAHGGHDPIPDLWHYARTAGGAGRGANPEFRFTALFRDAERKSGFPASVLQAMAYVESWGVANAESPAGPRGILQIAEATGKRMGLRIVYATRHRVTKTKTAVRNKHGKPVYRTVRHKETYTAMVRDDRLKPGEGHSGRGHVPGRNGATLRRPRLGHLGLPLRRRLRGRFPGHGEKHQRAGATFPPAWPRSSSAATRCGIASCVKRFTHRWIATTRPLIGSA